MTYQHEIEILPVSPSQEGLVQLCQVLDKKSAEGKECVTVWPMQIAEPALKNGVLTSRPQAAFGVIFRQAKEVENGEVVVLDGGKTT